MLKIALVVEQLRTPVGALSGALTEAGHEITVLHQGDDLTTALAACQPDVVHAHSWAVGNAALAEARKLDVPFVFTPHTLAGTPEPAVLRSADQVLATFKAQVPPLLAAGTPRQNISVVPYGVDVHHFTRTAIVRKDGWHTALSRWVT